MSKLMLFRLRILAILVVATTGIGILDAYLGNYARDPDIATSMYRGGILWFVGGALVWSFELLFVPSRFGAGIRKLHFVAAILFKSMVLVGAVIVTTLLGNAIFLNMWHFGFLSEPGFFRTLAFAFIVIILMQICIQIVSIIGARPLVNFLLGRYHQPVREEKIFMFLDLAGSTTMAEKIGDIGLQHLLTRFFFDIDEPIAEFGGEVHRYIGDQVVVTWPFGDTSDNRRIIECCFAIQTFMKAKADTYRREFGIVPEFRIGLHGGPVVISECGDRKKEISYFGDTVNSTARIEQLCKSLHCRLLLSRDLAERIELPPGYRFRSKGTVKLRGRQSETTLVTVEKDAEAITAPQQDSPKPAAPVRRKATGRSPAS